MREDPSLDTSLADVHGLQFCIADSYCISVYLPFCLSAPFSHFDQLSKYRGNHWPGAAQ